MGLGKEGEHQGNLFVQHRIFLLRAGRANAEHLDEGAHVEEMEDGAMRVCVPVGLAVEDSHLPVQQPSEGRPRHEFKTLALRTEDGGFAFAIPGKSPALGCNTCLFLAPIATYPY